MSIELSRMQNIARRVEELTGTAHKITARRKVRCLKCGRDFLSRANRVCDECAIKNARLGVRGDALMFV